MSYWESLKSQVSRARFLAEFTTLVALLTFVVAGIEAFNFVNERKSKNLTPEQVTGKIVVLEHQIEMLKGDIYSEGESVAEMDSARVVAIEVKQKALEEALSGDIDRVVSVALMRRDIDELRKQNDQGIASLASRVDSLFQLLIWTAGALLTTLIAVVGWLVASRKGK